MATEVYTKTILPLLNDEEVEVRPLAISKLRKFMRLWSDHIEFITQKIRENEDKPEGELEFNSADLTEAQFDVFIKMCALSLETQLKKDDETDKKFFARLEDLLDQETIYKILEVAGGLDLKKAAEDPNLPAGMSPVPGGTI